MYLFEQMEQFNHNLESDYAMGVNETSGISDHVLFAWEADFLAGDIILTDVNTGAEKTLLFENLIENIHPDDVAAIRSDISFISGYERRMIQLKIRYLYEGNAKIFEVKGMAFSRDDRVFAVGIAYDNLFFHGQNERLEYLQSHDALTGLANAAAFDCFVNDFFKFGTYPQTLIVAKIDRFKEINHSFGYNAGNTLITNVSGVIRECFFDAEIIARIGGGEYCVVYAGKSPLEIDNKIKQTRMMLHGMYMNLIKTDVSFGYSSAEKAVSFCDLYRQALNKMNKSSAIRTILTENTMIDCMNSIVESKAGWGKRQVRLQSLSSQVACVLGCSEECVDVVKVLAKIVDIGFISISGDLIKSRLKLSGDELNEYMRHIEYGRKLIGKIDELADMKELYLGIFKRFDEQSDGIPLPSRIIAGVRGFDDIVSSGKAGFRDITERFVAKRGKEYCPDVVDAIVDVAIKHYALR